uniref:Retrovirus-related Pol polyprotein from transposon TNT 1-94 n=1 Tax=Tanacetum cinerariifolium TaxID=118510 RepID=A0A699GHB5_TANCI|nr:retrovirus-related Pol polyprotein from transposon TNT 1-94 [Tanacetum cinerariifolium]
MNFVSKFLATVRFGNNHIASIMRYGDYQLGNMTISRVYYVEGLGHNLFFVGQFCDADLEVAFWKNTCFISSKTKRWLWHRRLSHLNISTLNKLAKDGLRGIPRLKFQKDHLCSACALGKRKKSSLQPKAEDTNQEKLSLLHMDLCGPMCVASINGKRYILVIVDDYSRFTWVRFLRTKDEALEAIIKCIKNIQVRLNAIVRNVRTDNGTEFVNQTLHEFYENIGIFHQTSVARTPQQNDIVKRRNQTLVEAARTMLIFSKASLYLWVEAINTACYTQNRSLIRLRFNKTSYELIQDKKLDLSFFYVFGSLCYPTNDNDDLGKLDAKADIGIFVGYTPAKKAFRIYNKRTRKIIETIHVTFDELTAMASKQLGLGLVPVVVSPRAIDLADSHVSTSIDQDAPSTSAFLGQRHEKHFRPIHYASKTMTDAESNYSTTEKEMLVVVYAFEKFWSYLIMNKSIVYTDHSALNYLFAKKDPKARLLRSYFPTNVTIPKRQRKQISNIVEPELRTIVEMADNRTMAQMLQAPIEGYEDAIVVPPINANNFELKQTLINLVQTWERFKDLLRQCLHHGFSELHQLDTFYNALNPNDQDAFESAAGGNFLDKIPRECLAIIESKSKVRYSRSRVTDLRVSTNASLPSSSPSNSFNL